MKLVTVTAQATVFQRKISHIINTLWRPTCVSSLFLLFIAACGGNNPLSINTVLDIGNLNLSSSSSTTSSTSINEGELTHITGKVGNGPTLGASIVFTDANSKKVASTVSDSKANYSVYLPLNIQYPLLVKATGGIDLVSNTKPNFDMMSVVLSDQASTVNISPLSTLIVGIAQAMPEGLTTYSLALAGQIINQQLNFGFDINRLQNPITSEITASNIAMHLKTNAMLAEMVNRTQLALQNAAIDIQQNALFDIFSADLADGKLDGQGPIPANSRFAAVAISVAAQILTEILDNSFRVDGKNAASFMDLAINITLPSTSTITTLKVPITQLLLVQTSLSLSAMKIILPSAAANAIDTLLTKILDIESGQALPSLFSFSTNQEAVLLNDAVLFTINATELQINAINDTIKNSETDNLFSVATDDASASQDSIDSDYSSTENTLAIESPLTIYNVTSSLANSSYPVANVVDGNIATYWASYGMPHWLLLDLGAAVDVKKLQLSFLQYDVGRTYNYSVAVSLDNTQWFDLVINAQSGASQWESYQFSNTKVQFIRITSHSASNSTWAAINEVRVFENLPIDTVTNSDGTGNSTTDNADPLGWSNVDTSTDESSAPIANHDDVNTAMDTTVTVDILANDLNLVYLPLSITVITPPANGETNITLNDDIVYKPKLGFYGLDSFVYKIIDAKGNTTTANVNVKTECSICDNDTALTLAWNPNSDSILGYYVYFGQSVTAVNQRLFDLSVNSNTFNAMSPSVQVYASADLGLQPGDTVCFKLQAYDETSISDLSEVACGQI